MKREERISTGLKKLDRILEGGLLENSAILLVGKPRCGKTIFALQYLNNCLKNGNACILILTNNSAENIVKRLIHYGWKFEKYKKNLRIIDAYSRTTGEKKFIIKIGKAALSDILIATSQALDYFKNKKVSIILDSLSSLLLYNELPKVTAFLEELVAKIRTENLLGLIVIEEGMHDPSTIALLESLTDSTIVFKEENKKNFISARGFRVSKGELLKLIKYKVTDYGIKLL